MITEQRAERGRKNEEIKGKDLSIVIPAFNEEDGIGLTLEGLLEALPQAEIIVVDDGSTDRTPEVIAKFSTVKCLKHDFNKGYGSALKNGIESASRRYIAWFDADNEHKVEDLEIMYAKISSHKLAAIIAQRKESGISIFRNWGKWLIRMLARTFSIDVGIDVNCGLRVFRRDVIGRYLSLLPDGYSASTTSTLIMLERKYPIEFHDISTNPRIGYSKVKLTDGYHALVLVLRLVMCSLL